MKFVNEVLENIWKDRYQKNNETLDDNFKRVARYVGKTDEERQEFYDIMKNVLFLPAGRTMSNSGIGRDLTLNNCFVSPQIRDDLTDIFQKVALGAKTHQRGGGIGYDFSQLRPKGSPTSNDAIASGAVSFMDVFNAQTATILQGNRRGANMGIMNVYNMDIEDFITAKSQDSSKLNHFNVSVMVDNDFMSAVRNNEKIYLHYPVYNEEGKIEKNPNKWVYKKEVSAKYIWDLIMRMAYDNGEPGIFFYDNLNDDNNLWYTENIVCTNPCSEYLAGTIYGYDKHGNKLNPNEFGGACNLGSLFLHNFVDSPFMEGAKIDWDKLKDTIFTAVRMLDNIIDINNFPDEIYENYQKSFRTIGLGITGLADALAMLNIKYNSQEANSYVSNLMDFIALNVYRASIELSKEKGEFPLLDRERFVESGFIEKHCLYSSYLNEWQQVKKDILKYGIRNAKMISVAPVGTLSLTYGNNCSSGLEPIFSLEYERKVKIGGQADDKTKIVPMRDYAYEKWLQVKGNSNCKVGKDVFVTALEMTVNEHINMLATVAYHVDMSCSKTINVPTDYSFENTKKIYERCHELGVKGCTIFRPNAIREGIMITENTETPKDTSVVLSELPRGYVIKTDNNCIGKKRTLYTGCGTLHCTAFFDPVTGDLLETYFSKGSQGGCLNTLTGLSRMISLSARGGIDIHSIVDQLQSAGTCPSYAVRSATKHNTSKGSSCPVAIGNALLDMYYEMQSEISSDEDEEEIKQEAVVRPKKEIISSKSLCPDCGADLIFEGGCVTCKDCGYNKCE